jgi:hypothetical protein
VLLGTPLLLVLVVAPNTVAKRIVAFLRGFRAAGNDSPVNAD